MGTAGQSITLANSIIGVGILAMPFCFQQCGVVLATVILLFMGLISRLCCYFLLKSALIARRRNFEFLAFHVFGPAGKLAVEIGIIGFLMGTCIAYFVVVGDLGPQIIAKMLNINQSDILRTSIMVVVSLVCVLPLGLLRNVDSLSNVSAATIGFYFCLVIKVIAEAATQLFSSEWHSRVEMWKPSGILQCVPIFSMALFCQTQLFEIFESLPTLSLEKMNVVTKNAINICTAVYFTLGLFGYIAFSSHTISGNILMSLSPTMASDVIKLGFVMSVAFSFPLIIFPCRASLYSALYRRAHPAHHDHIINHSIPEATFRCITVAIIAVALFISLLLPNIELVLGLVGSTIGVLVCVLFPAACFVNITYKNTNERILAKGVLILGLVILVLGTYANLQAAESSHDRYDDSITPERIDKIVEDFFEKMEKQDKPYKQQQPKIIKDEILKKEIEKDSVIQPPNPLPPVSNEKHLGDEQKNKENKVTPPPTEKLVPVAENLLDKMPESHPKNLKTKLNGIQGSNSEPVLEQILDKPKQENAKPQFNQVKDKTDEKDDLIKQKELIETIKQHREEQKELIEEQKEILDKLIQTKKELQKNKKEENAEEDAKKVAVESIQKIANMAIKSLTGVSEKPDEDQKDGKKNEPNTANEVVQEIAEKAVKAIVEIAEQKPAKQDKNNMAKPVIANIENAPNDNINSVPVLNNDQANIILQPNAPNNILRPSVSNFAPINPPKLLPAESLVQNQNIPETVAKNKNVPENPNNSPIGNPQPIGNNAQVNSNLPPDQQLPLINQNIPEQSAQIQQQNQKPSQIVQQQDGLNFQQQNQLDQQQNQLNEKQHQLNQQQNQLNQQQIQLDQQQNQLVQQTQVKQQKREVEEQNIQKDQIIDNGQSAQQIQKDQNTNSKKAHSHSPDEPQSYKQGEDTQQNAQIKDIVAQNVPIPIATNNNVQESEIKAMNVVNNGNRLPVDVKNTQNGLNKIETVQNDNGAKDNPNNLENNAVPRQKREVIDCTKTLSQPEDKEICKVIADNKVESDNKITTISEELLPPNVDLAKIGLNSIPIELIHHGRSLKSIDKMEKKR